MVGSTRFPPSSQVRDDDYTPKWSTFDWTSPAKNPVELVDMRVGQDNVITPDQSEVLRGRDCAENH